MSNNLRTRDGQPFNFIDGLDIRGVNFDRYFDGYAPKESPAFTGTPTAPTAPVNTGTTQVATTAFVLGQAANTSPRPLGSSADAGTSTMFARADHVHEAQTTVSGNAESASVLETPRKINGTEFDGSKDILIANPTFSGGLADYAVDDANVPSTQGLAARCLSANAANKPNGYDHALLVMNFSDVWGVQIAGDWRTNTWYVRTQNDGTWGDWKSLLHSGNYGNLALPLSGGSMSGAITFSRDQTWPTFNQNTTGNAATATKVNFQDTRNVDIDPYDYAGVSLHIKDNGVDGINDGGTLHGVLNLAQWLDSTGGLAHQLAFTDNSNIYHRTTADGVVFSSWAKLWSTRNDGADSGLDADMLDGHQSTTLANPSTIVVRDDSGDIRVRSLRSEYSDEPIISGALAFRTESAPDGNNHIRFCNDADAIKDYLGAANSEHSHSAATATTGGFMSSQDKINLDGISDGNGSLKYVTLVRNAETPNLAAPVHGILAYGDESIVDLLLSPKGTGAILAQVPDNTEVGGSKRGIRAVDLQMERSHVSSVGSGNYSVVSGGHNNSATGTLSVSSGGSSNTASGNYSVVSGGASNVASNQMSVVSGGDGNVTAGQYSAISGGASNSASGDYSVISGGGGNAASAVFSAVSGGDTNNASGDYSVISGGDANVASAAASVVSGGGENVASGNFSTVPGGKGANTNYIEGLLAYGFGTGGNEQMSFWGGQQVTTDAQPYRITSTGTVSPTATNQLTLRYRSAYYLNGTVVAKVMNGTVCRSWKFDAMIRRGTAAADTYIVGTPTITTAFADGFANGWNVSLSADVVNGALAIVVNGADGVVIRWFAVVHSIEVVD